jgi:hypothetical protein
MVMQSTFAIADDSACPDIEHLSAENGIHRHGQRHGRSM